jgi:HprK-related kinase A
MIVQDLPVGKLRELLNSEGVGLKIGQYRFLIRSNLPDVEHHIHRLYAKAYICELDEFYDFPIEVRPVKGLRRWVKPLAEFVFNGNVPFTPLPAGQAPALLEWGINWCLSAFVQTHLIFHAAVVEKAGRALILPGPSGSGKSTLCTSLVAKGWRLLSDELTMLNLATGKVDPIPKPISLKNASIPFIEQRWKEGVKGKECHETTKGVVAHFMAPDISMLSSDVPADPAWVLFPKFNPSCSFDLSVVDKGAAFLDLIDNAFNYHVLNQEGFHALEQCVRQCEMFDLEYNDVDAVIAWLDSLL